MLNLAHLMGDSEMVAKLDANIAKTFVRGEQIFCQIDWLGIRHCPDTLRWAVMPYVYALAVLERGDSI